MSPEAALANVQNLYTLQTELWKLLDARKLNPNQKKEAKKVVREFGSLLRAADPSYMGGEDVYETLQGIHKEATKKVSGN